MEIERNYYTEAMRRIQAEGEEEDTEELKQTIAQLEEYNRQHLPIPNAEKQKWFEALAIRALVFAKICELDVRVQTTDDMYGVIRFETSYFELSAMEQEEMHSFWLYLCSKGEMKISHGPEVFIMEFWYALFDRRA